jgi:acyl-CoA synthetase (AMP-forming)/AMP-acid ligase II
LIHCFRKGFETLCSQDTQQQVLINPKVNQYWNYGELLDVVVRFSSLLWVAGLRPGDRVFSLLPNSTEQLVAFLASLWFGLDFCPISPSLTAEERRQCLLMFQASAGLVPDEIDASVTKELSQMTTKHLLIPIQVDGDLRRQAAEIHSRAHDFTVQSGRLILFTSGTTSHPKAMVINGDRLWSSARAWAGSHPAVLGSDARFYNTLPMSYLGGLFNLGLIPLACHGSVVISNTYSGASALRFWRDVEKNDVNTLWLPPTVLRGLMTLYKGHRGVGVATSKTRVCFLGMAPIALHEKLRFEEMFDIPVLENFALSETTFLSSEEFGSPLKRCEGSVGKTLPWVTLRLGPLEGDPSKFEIQVKSPFLFEGYLTSHGEAYLPLTHEGYFPTGDLGEFNQDGVLLLKGRCKEIIKKGGYLVWLRDLEEVAERHPSVREAAAVGVPHEFYGESSVLCVRLVEGGQSPRQVLMELISLLTETLSKFKWPEKVIALKSFPTTESGKVQRWRLSTWLDSGAGIIDSVNF